MRYLVIHDLGNEGCIVDDFDTRLEADKHLSERFKSSYANAEDFRLIEFTQEFDVAIAAEKYEESLHQKRKAALDKLTEADKIVLGIA